MPNRDERALALIRDVLAQTGTRIDDKMSTIQITIALNRALSDCIAKSGHHDILSIERVGRRVDVFHLFEGRQMISSVTFDQIKSLQF